MSGTTFDAFARSCASFEWEKPGKSDGLLAKESRCAGESLGWCVSWGFIVSCRSSSE
jgi:hypothetical protein